MSAEYSICTLFGIENTIENDRISKFLTDKFLQSDLVNLLEKNDI